MNKQNFTSLAVGLVIGVGATMGMAALLNKGPSTSQSPTTDHSMMSMNDMTKQLEGLSGDAYDKAFLEMMIAHHQGAIDMAELSAAKASHDEVKQLSASMILTEQQEVMNMQQWQAKWGYGKGESMDTMMHHDSQ